MNHKPTDLPHGDRRAVRVILPMPAPAAPPTVEAVFLAAARLIHANGHWQDDYVPDACDREMTVPASMRPMSIVAALRCAVSGDPMAYSLLADEALMHLAVAIDPEPERGDIFALEGIVEDWGDEPGRSGDEVVELLELVATTPARAA